MSTQQPVQAYIGLGSNLDNPVQQLQQALIELAQLPGSDLQLHSSLYRSDPVGPPGQPDYINAVARISTVLDAHQLLDQLQSLEKLHQRVRTQRWGPRTLDLDILLYAQHIIDSQRLQVPHPYIQERNFVLYPLAEMNPDLVLPDGTLLSDLLARCPLGTLQRLAL